MNSTYSELLKQRTELDQKIEQARKEELDSAIQQIRDLMDQYGITAQEIMPNGARTAVRRETLITTGMVLVMVLVFSLFFLFADTMIRWGLGLILGAR